MGVNANAYDGTGVRQSAGAIDTSNIAVNAIYNVQYSSALGTVSMQHQGTTGIEGLEQLRALLRVTPNPTRGLVRFIVAGIAGGELLEIYDVTGRRVDVIRLGTPGAAPQSVSWNWNRAGCGTGIYLARVRPGRHAAVRFAVLR
jgi:hypothetical protein